MTMTGLDTFDATIHKTNLWLNEIMAELDSADRHEAYHALRVVLQALRDRLTVEEAVQFGAQLPMLVRGFYYEGWNPAGKPVKFHRPEFLQTIRHSFRREDDLDPERVARAVFKVIAAHVSDGELRDVKNILPKDLRTLWPRQWWD
jgi:uncharacterized protein (DUF2267 family)